MLNVDIALPLKQKKYQASWTNETILQQTYDMFMSGI